MNIIEIFKVIIFGITEGITEWLPISSTGHMIILNEFLPLKEGEDFYEVFEVMIQLGAVMAVASLFFKKLFPFERSKRGIRINYEKILLWIKIIIATIPIAVLGLLFDDFLDEHLYNVLTVAMMLILYGVLFIIIENINVRKKTRSLNDLSLKKAFLIGLFQCLSLIPGTSRSGATILGGMLLGLTRGISAEFSFFLSLPAMLGASLLKLIKKGLGFSMYQYLLILAGMTVSFLVSLLCIRFLMDYVKKHDFKTFGAYRIIMGAGIILLYYLGWFL